VLFLDLGMAAEQLHALASRRPFAGSDPAKVPRGRWRTAENAPFKVASDYYRFQLLTGGRGMETCEHKLHE
jgi:hypothetical protein